MENISFYGSAECEFMYLTRLKLEDCLKSIEANL